ncbi:hypothetical protein UA32_12600 [Photobacterium angustum]|uniref:Integrase n=1 Tax=Photobacterium angustum TaxID=661 RepID=A0ABX5H138_PHOAN|nr:tyrosine-type recombinase/integrase [Photobacterium angustum]KJG37785.1 hypothetical protein UA32_12600 [Photobacterium angustum]PSX07055.1 hypothetical protein C0W27_15920 [Photobacterium angustum]
MKFYPFFLPHNHKDEIIKDCSDALFLVNEKIDTAFNTYEHAMSFLEEFIASVNNYDSYRNEINAFLNWAWFVECKDVRDINRNDINNYIRFTCSPPENLIASWSQPVLNESENGVYVLNPNWRPFTNKKKELGIPYSRKETTIKKTLSSLSSFYQFLNDCEVCEHNPPAIALRRLNVKNIHNFALSDDLKDKALSQSQVNAVFDYIKLQLNLNDNPAKWQRARFLFAFLVLAYPRRSEIAPRLNWSPSMSDFRCHNVNGKSVWTFFIPKSKNGQSREVILSDGLLTVLKEYRNFLGLSSLPRQNETNIPLFTRIKEATTGRQVGVLNANLSASQLGDVIVELFNLTADHMELSGADINEADDLRTRTIHSLRHTGISNDLAERSAKDVMKCSGHSSLQALAIYTSSRIEFRVEKLNHKDNIFKV